MQMKCDVSESVHGTQQNHSSPTSFHHLDATLFYSSARSDVSDLSGTARRGGYDDEYKVDTSVPGLQAGPSPFPVFTLSDVTDGVDGDLLRAVFLLSDLVVLVYRLTVTYVTVRALRRRFTIRHCTSSCQGSGGVSGQMVADGGSMLRSSSSRTALTSTSGPGLVPDMSNIYIDPQSLVVENCATVLHRQMTSVDDCSSCPRRRSDVKYPSGHLMLFCFDNRYRHLAT